MADETFSEAYPELLRVAYRAALRVTGDPQTAEDIAAEALTRAILRWNRIADHARPWVARVATNLAIDHTRRRARRHRIEPDRSDETSDGPDTGATVDLHRALRTLPRRQRQVVALRYFGDLTEQEIARELGMAAGTVKSHASRGLATLRRLLADAAAPDSAAPGAIDPEPHAPAPDVRDLAVVRPEALP